MSISRTLFFIIASFVLLSCGQNGASDSTIKENTAPKEEKAPEKNATVEIVPDKKPAVREFRIPPIPSTLADEQSRLEYLIKYYWDEFFNGSGRTDSLLVLGVRKGQVEQAFSNYSALLGNLPLEKSDGYMHGLFSKLSAKQRADSTSHLYLVFTEIVSRYLYDPNSPMRNEDLYLPFVKDMAESDLSDEDRRVAYRYEAWACSLNRRGSVAPDFRIKFLDGKTTMLHSIKAERTLLFFSNPGCQNCREIGEALMSNGMLVQMMKDGYLAVVNVYIDENLEEWKKYASGYPGIWISGYDAGHVIRDEHIYDVRAIPSLYLLDSEKRVMLKDAPLEKVFEALLGQR